MSLKAYLVTTGTVFGLIALLHTWKLVDEWHLLATDRWLVLGGASLGAVAACLSTWAWRLLRNASRP